MQNLNSLKHLLLNQKERNDELTKLLTYPEILADQKLTQYFLREQREIAPFVAIQLEIENLQEELSITEELNANETQIQTFRNQINDKYLSVNQLLSSSQVDSFDGACIEVCANDLNMKNLIFNEYLNFACKNKLEYSLGSEINIYGKNVFTRLFNSKGKYSVNGVSIQIYVLPFIEMKKEINPRELKIDYYHSSGAGGQNINKVETAVRITHLLTGISVTCQDERSQKQNKEKALLKIQERFYSDQIKQYEKLIKEYRTQQQKILKQTKLDSATQLLVGV